MPSEISLYWWGPVAVIAVAIVCIVAVWFTRFVVDRLDKDRSHLDAHDTKFATHEMKIEEHDEAIKDLKGRRK